MSKIISTEKIEQAEKISAIASEWEANGGTAFSGESYEAGVAAALNWILGHTDTAPEVEPYEE
jgi:hypothetical protein